MVRVVSIVVCQSGTFNNGNWIISCAIARGYTFDSHGVYHVHPGLMAIYLAVLLRTQGGTFSAESVSLSKKLVFSKYFAFLLNRTLKSGGTEWKRRGPANWGCLCEMRK
ncbi:hypothetical protein DPMN_132227 [Dreissena polymorpha]|uniref:Uncharacterized protein n=1 Tax=Dreissena polymorpha TaxID=45954 RepID=A0A9D4FWC9_DREPO|nr:hypothetical protein DPMN_132227 [Dreissena polymorpha]